MIYVKHSTDHALTPLQDFVSLEAAGITVTTLQGQLTICAVNKEPNTPICTMDLRKFQRLCGQTLILGYLNAKHTVCNSSIVNATDRKLLTYAERHDIGIRGPTTPTRIPRRRKDKPDVLDIALSINMQCDINLHADHDLSSDHLPVLVYPNYIKGHNPDGEPTLNYNKTNCPLFHKGLTKELYRNMTPELEDQEAVDQEAVTLSELLMEAIKKHTPLEPRCNAEVLPTAIRRLQNERNRLLRQYTRDERRESDERRETRR